MIPMVFQRLDNISKWEHPLPELPTITAKRMWYCSVGHGHPPALRAAVDSMGADRYLPRHGFSVYEAESFSITPSSTSAIPI